MSDLTLVIGNQNYSSWSLRPWLFLRFHKIPFAVRKVALFTDRMERDLAPYFSGGKVPVLLDGDLQVWDSLAILEHLSDCFPEKGGWPTGAAARAQARSVCAEMHSSFTDLRSEMPMNCRRRFPGFRVSAATSADLRRIYELWRYCRSRYGGAGPWLFGRFSNADCMFAPVVLRLHSYIENHDADIAEYIETVYSCEPIQEWVEAGRGEAEVIEEGEADWPSVPLL